MNGPMHVPFLIHLSMPWAIFSVSFSSVRSPNQIRGNPPCLPPECILHPYQRDVPHRTVMANAIRKGYHLWSLKAVVALTPVHYVLTTKVLRFSSRCLDNRTITPVGTVIRMMKHSYPTCCVGVVYPAITDRLFHSITILSKVRQEIHVLEAKNNKATDSSSSYPSIANA